MCDENHNTIENFNKLVEKGDIVKCPSCMAYNAYAYQDTNMDGIRLTPEDGFSDGGELYTDEELLTNWPDVYHIGLASCAGWECRKCGLTWVEKDSVYANYGHSEYNQED